eukprot:5392575-Pleurochrysis_carterae.AAC.3
MTSEFEPPPRLPVARPRICLWSEHVTSFRRCIMTRACRHESFRYSHNATSLSALRGNDLSFGVRVAAAGLYTRSSAYSGFGTAQGVRQIRGQRKAPGGRGQRKAPAGEGGQRKAPGGGGQSKAAGEEGQCKAPAGGGLTAHGARRREMAHGAGW